MRSQTEYQCQHLYACAFRRRRVVRPSVRSPKYPLSTCTWSVGPPDQLWPFYGMSVRPERFPGICWRTHGGNGLQFCTLMYLDHLQNWLVYGDGLFIFLILALFWLSETGEILGFRAFPEERIEGMAWNFACCCILTTFRTDQIMVAVCWFSSLWCYFDLVKRVKFGVSRHFGHALWFSSLWWPFDWNWSCLGFLCIIWRTCGSKCRGGGGIFLTLCVEFCLVECHIDGSVLKTLVNDNASNNYRQLRYQWLSARLWYLHSGKSCL